MEMANFWVNLLSSGLKNLAMERKNIIETNKKLFENVDEDKKKFEDFEIYKQVKKYYSLIGAFEYKIFNRLRTADKINKKWDYIAALLKQA